MKSFRYFFYPLFVLASACTDQEEFSGCPNIDGFDDLSGYELVWQDEFDSDVIDTNKWSFDIGDGCDRGICGWGNNELQYYTARSENAYISDGKLVIKAIREFRLYEGKLYTSARMVTKNKGDWRYGRIDVRAKLPIGQGMWPAIWMLSTDNAYGDWPTSGEIDIMEMTGDRPSRVLGTIHYGHDFRRFNSYEYLLESGTFHDDFHVFSVIWTEDCIRFYVDGEAYGEPQTRSSTLPSTWPFDQKFHLIMNIAVGGNLPGNPGATTRFPQIMEVDYVRVYQ